MKGVFCLEGPWFGDQRDKTSVLPILDLVNRYQKLNFVYHRCCTKEELKFSLNRWKRKDFHNKFPLLYLAFHGEEGAINIGNINITLNDIAEILEDKCKGTIIYFGSCSTMKMDKRLLQNFLSKTNALAILGYKHDVDWLVSASFEIRLLSYLNTYKLDSKGANELYNTIKLDCKSFVRELDFRMVINEKTHFPRKRKK